MTGNVPTDTTALRSLLDRLDEARPAPDPDRLISAFTCRQRERVRRATIDAHSLAIIVEGRKEIDWGPERWTCTPGTSLMLPAGAVVDVVNVPDETTGSYRAMLLRFPRRLLIKAARRWPELAKAREPRVVAIPPDDALQAAALRAAQACAPDSARLREHRVMEVVLMLAERRLLGFSPKYVEQRVADAIRLLLRHRLERPWNAGSIAKELGLSESVLRRRLRDEGAGVGTLLRGERMAAARTLLEERDADVAEALAATGYVSRSHFARHFAETFGMKPSEAGRSNRDPAQD